MLQQIGDQACKRENAGQDAAHQHQQEGRVGHLPGVLDTATQEQQKRFGNAGDGAQQFVIDTADKSDGAARNAWHHIGSAHGHALGIEQEMFLHGSFQSNGAVRPAAH